MRKLLLLALLLLLSNFGQGQTTGPGFVIYVGSAPSGTCSAGAYLEQVIGLGTVYTCQSGTWAQISGGGGGGGVTSVATTTPITGGTITGTGTIACATCVKATSPGAGIAHFAGSTQEVTSSLIVAADVTSGTITGTQIASSVALAGSPTTTTQSASDNSTKVATTAYVDATANRSIGKRFCANVSSGASATNTCSSIVNVATNDVMILFCQYFLSDAGASTVSVSDSLTNSWTQIKDFYSSQMTDRLYAYWAKSSSSGADTFTCTSNSASASFWGTAAVSIVGASGTAPVDTAPAGTQGTTTTPLGTAMTTAGNGELGFLWVSAGNNGTTYLPSVLAPVFASSAQGTFLGTEPLGVAGAYALSIYSTGASWGAIEFAIK